MQLVFLLIFLVFIFLNVILGLISSRKKRKRQAVEIQQQEETAEQKPQKLEELEEIYKEQRTYEEGDRFPEMSPGAGRPMEPPSVAEELSSTLSGQPPGASAKRPSQPSVAREIFPMTQNFSFLHEQSADNILTPQYTLSEELPFPPEKPPETQERAEGISGLRQTVSYTVAPYETGIRRPALSAVQKLEAFPPLKRAIVFSEILGTPKGLSGF